MEFLFVEWIFAKLIFMHLQQERKIKFSSYLEKLLENYEIVKTLSTWRKKIKVNTKLKSNQEQVFPNF